MSRTILIIVGVVAVVSVAYITGYQVGRRSEAIKKSDPEAWKSSRYASSPLVKDAVRRWSIKGGEPPETIMENRLVSWLSFPDRDCVSLYLKPGSVGGSPIYCYAKDRSQRVPRATARLIAEYSDVE